MSGQQINLDKTEINFSTNMPMATKDVIMQQLGVSSTAGHLKYLGLPSFIGRNKLAVFQSIKERVSKKLLGWKERVLSRAGKEVLIKAVAQSIPTYAMSCFRLPKELISKLNGLMAKFLWGSLSSGKSVSWIRWTKLCQPKSYSGLGFRSLEEFNCTLLAKQCWRLIQNPSSLFAKVLKTRYFANSNLWEAGLGFKPSHL